MPTLIQKLRLAFRGWQRRREESQREFVTRNASWGSAPVAAATAPMKKELPSDIDREGLQCAFLDESGQIAYYLDIDSGEVVEVRDGPALAAPRYRRVPTRTVTSEEDDRRAFIAQLDPGESRDALARRVDAPEAFRRVLAQDRALEKAWYNFKNDRAIAAIETWLRS